MVTFQGVSSCDSLVNRLRTRRIEVRCRPLSRTAMADYDHDYHFGSGGNIQSKTSRLRLARRWPRTTGPIQSSPDRAFLPRSPCQAALLPLAPRTRFTLVGALRYLARYLEYARALLNTTPARRPRRWPLRNGHLNTPTVPGPAQVPAR